MMITDNTPLFADRPEWSDVTPLEQYDLGLSPLAPIIYTVEYKDASNYFRGIVKTGEKSPRVLELTERMIKLNPAHYTAWQYRYETLLSLLFPSPSSPLPSPSSSLTTKKSALVTHPLISNELTLLDELSTHFLKTYQVWHHRRLIVCLTGEWKRELDCTARVLEGWQGDEKNYHTWSYRQWILGYFGGSGLSGVVDCASEDGNTADEKKDSGIWSNELPFVDTMISKDVRNNSAWHHRFFVVWGCGVREGEEDRERVLLRELTYIKQKISLAPNNPSAWNYLRGVLQATATSFSSVLAFVEPYTRPQSPENIKDTSTVTDADLIVDLDSPLPTESAQLPCVEALEFLADVYEAQAAEGKDDIDVESAVSIWKNLAEQYDPIRKNYWQYRIRIANTLASKIHSTG